MAALKITSAVTAITSLAALATPAFAQDLSAEYPTLTTDILEGLGNSSLFTRWRPRSHYMSPHSWMNDPCGPLYDPTTETYHLHYQYHPNHVNWGNISWGHAVSKDLFHWTDVRDWANDSAVSLASGKYPSGPLSQFTGTSQPVNLQGEQDGTILTFATGIQFLPTNWKIPYTNGTEVQALYTSSDGGLTWEEVGTVLDGPPDGWNVTGWRDPSFFPSTLLDELLSVDEPHYYMVLGSGLKGGDVPFPLPGAERPGFLGPRIPLYAAPASNLEAWEFLGALWEPAANSSLGVPDVTGSYGYNFEVSSLFELDTPSGGKAWFFGAGAEGGNTTTHWREQWALWNRGEVSARENGSVAFAPNSGGALDWGMAYAQATWNDTKENRRVMWGWAIEEVNDAYVFNTTKQLGYNGVMTLPTELFVKETKNVLNCDVQPDGNLCVKQKDGSFTAETLGLRPLPDVLDLMRNGSEAHDFDVGELHSTHHRAVTHAGSSYELKATLSNFNGTAGILVAQSPDHAEYTVIYLDPETKQISVNRDHSSLLPHFGNRTFVGHFEAYEIRESGSNKTTTEDVNFHVVVDGSLLEVWVNERFAMTARMYPSRSDSTGISFFAGSWENKEAGGGCKQSAEGDEDEDAEVIQASWSNVQVWKGLSNAWPDRPSDSSVQLVWDSPEDTNNYTWWAGY
ncbi:hypothetical protein VD0004_g2232 [Verticillium dahliae]|uniref:Levanase n=1 Tax=Verticillium dahliae TaxID=27337 RepID=A0A444RUN6_VERDA|nr:hypothetical protein VD0004_g2232 [Verticillium dahliae]PNH75256.1 hypothetical protein VD0001_g2325 [Verticillium dahliae]RXG44872.1 hypothetical protein VDGE_03792 [Verticillium dahliae]